MKVELNPRFVSLLNKNVQSVSPLDTKGEVLEKEQGAVQDLPGKDVLRARGSCYREPPPCYGVGKR